MRTVLAFMNRNRKLFFKDKGMLFTSMITPVILIVLYATFLAKVFRDSFTAAIPDMITISDKLINGTVAAQLTASLMAVSCITVCSFIGIVISIITRKTRKIHPALWISGIISCMLGFIVCMFVFSMLIVLMAAK